MALIDRSAATIGIAALSLLSALASRDARALEGGQISAHGRFAIVGSFAPDRSALGSGFSGVHIAPRWVLTAGHVAPAKGAIFVDRCGMAGVSEVLTFPTRVPTQPPMAGALRDDLALVRLAAPVQCPYFPRLAEDGALPDPGTLARTSSRREVTLVSNNPSMKAQRFGFARVLRVYRVPGFDLVAVDSKGVALVVGDSGSPLFLGKLTDTDRESVVVGIASAQSRSHTGVAIGVYTWVGPYRTLLDAAVESSGESLQWYSALPSAAQASKDKDR